MLRLRALAGLLALSLASAAHAQVDPLTVRVDDSAAQRFAKLWRSTNGKPTAAQIQAGYLAQGGRGIEVFTPNRIVSAERLATTIAKKPELYADAVDRCLPWVSDTNAQLRSIYLGLKGLFPTRELPQIAVVFGANNSGGTAGPGIQVIGLEVICRLSPDRAAFDEIMRQFFAHETVHTFQQESNGPSKDPLLAAALSEGVPDYVTMLVTGRAPDAKRDAWAREHEASVWRDFRRDSEIVRAGTHAKGEMTPAAKQVFRRWFANAGDPPAGWPSELGYWVGMRISEAYVDRAAAPHAAIEDLIRAADPAAILARSHYGEAATQPKGTATGN